MTTKAPDDTSIHYLLGQLATKIDGMSKKLDDVTDDHEKRLRTLEEAKHKMTAVAALLATGFTLLINFLGKKFL